MCFLLRFWRPDLKEFSCAECKLFQEILGGRPRRNSVGLLDVLSLGPLQHCANVIFWVANLLNLNLAEENLRIERSGSTVNTCLHNNNRHV